MKIKIMRKHLICIFSALLLIGIIASIIPGCNSDNDTEHQPAIERIKLNGVLLSGTTVDYHPFTFLEPNKLT